MNYPAYSGLRLDAPCEWSGYPQTVRDIIAQTALDHRVTPRAILSRDKRKQVSFARFDAAVRLREMRYGTTRVTFPMIAAWLNFADHTSAIYAVRRWEKLAMRVALSKPANDNRASK